MRLQQESERSADRRRVRAGMAHDCADLTDRETVTVWALAIRVYIISLTDGWRMDWDAVCFGFMPLDWFVRRCQRRDGASLQAQGPFAPRSKRYCAQRLRRSRLDRRRNPA